MLKVPFCTHGTSRLLVDVYEMNLVFEAGVRQHSILRGKDRMHLGEPRTYSQVI
jgi:hypothetical protein